MNVTASAPRRDLICGLLGAACAFALGALSTPGLLAPALCSLAFALAAVVA